MLRIMLDYNAQTTLTNGRTPVLLTWEYDFMPRGYNPEWQTQAKPFASKVINMLKVTTRPTTIVLRQIASRLISHDTPQSPHDSGWLAITANGAYNLKTFFEREGYEWYQPTEDSWLLLDLNP